VTVPGEHDDALRSAGSDARGALTRALADALADVPSSNRCVAVSGGRDSMTLLHVLAEAHAAADAAPPRVLHVHHGLHAPADRWAAAVADTCAGLGAPFEMVRVDVRENGEGPEAAARRARYDAFAAHLRPGEHLLLAHHRDDQVETVLLRLLRGAGPRGLAGMPRRRALGGGWLLRPWLDVPRSLIEAVAAKLSLAWHEDPSNGDGSVDRAFLRRQLLPQLEARWPGARVAMLRSAAACGELEAVVESLLPAVPGGGAPMPLALLPVDAEGRRALLRTWLAAADVPMPPRVRLEELLRQLEAADDAKVAISVGDRTIRRHDGALHLVRLERPTPREATVALRAGGLHVGCGLLELVPASATGPALRADLPDCQVRFRTGGERLRLAGRPGTTLKRVLQDAGVPPWDRDRVPLLCAGEEILAVAGIGVCEGGLAAPGATGLEVRWTPDPAPGEGSGTSG
jgi:tRNA(Ile)-lysidine synthase